MTGAAGGAAAAGGHDNKPQRALRVWPPVRGALLAVVLLAALIPPAQAADAVQTWVWSDPAGGADAGALRGALERLGLVHNELEHLGMLTFRADAETAQALHRLAGGRLDAGHSVPLHLDESVPYVGADVVKRALGPRPTGPTVLVVDTGVDSGHPDFDDGNLAANVQPVRVGGLPVGSNEDAPVVDQAGHGTHVAGTVAGSGDSLGTQDQLHGRYTGVYAIGRVASYQASSTQEGEEAQVEVVSALEAFDWALANQERLDIRVVTNSWGEPGAFDPDNPINYASRRLYLAGITVVFSAGNAGEDGPGTLNRYCVAPWVLCVAAGNLEGEREGFSSYGSGDPGKPYDHPDLTAPGLFVTAARPVGRSTLPFVGLLSDPTASRELYVDKSGTSIAAPHVAGTAALLQAANPSLSPDQVMELIVGTATPMQGDVAEVGAGYLDAEAAFRAAMQADGERAAFLAGDAVRYAGAASGDATYAADPVAVAGPGAQVPVSSLVRGSDRLWVATPAAIAVLLAVAAVAVAGTRWR